MIPPRVALLALLALLIAACTPVRPWQRDVLSRPQMQPVPHPLDASAREHAHQAREGAGGGIGSGGGGCGCY